MNIGVKCAIIIITMMLIALSGYTFYVVSNTTTLASTTTTSSTVTLVSTVTTSSVSTETVVSVSTVTVTANSTSLDCGSYVCPPSVLPFG